MIYRVTIDAFALTPEVAEAFKAVRDDRLYAKSRVNVMAGGMMAAAAHYADKQTPQLILVEDEGEAPDMLEGLERLAEVCEPGTRVIVVGKLDSIAHYRALLAQGVTEYLVRPVTAQNVMASLAAALDDPAAQPRGRVIAFWGARGGVGASTLAQNVAWAIGERGGEDTILIDLDVGFGTSNLAFNIDAKQTVAEALANPERLDDVLLERFLVAYGDRLRILAAPGDPRLAAPVTVEALDRVLDLAARMAPMVVLDIPHIWAPWTEYLLGAADELILVANPDLPCLRDAKTILGILGAKQPVTRRLVLNRFDASRKTQLSPKDFEENVGIKPALVVPFDPQFFGQAANNGRMLGEEAKTHKLAELVGEFAVRLVGRSGGPRRSGAGKVAKGATDAKNPWGWLKMIRPAKG